MKNQKNNNQKKLLFHQKKEKKLLMTEDCFKHSIKMEYQKIINVLGNIPDKVPRFVTKKCVEIYDESGGTNNVNKELRFKIPQLRSGLCDYNDAYIIVAGKTTVTNRNNNAYDKKVALKNNAPLFSCISKINNTLIDYADDLDVVMPLYNLLTLYNYSKNYRKATGSL